MSRGRCYSERQPLYLMPPLIDVRTTSAGWMGSAGAVMPCDRRALCGRICPGMRSATRPHPRNSATAIFFPAAAPLLAQQQDRRAPSCASAAA